MIAENDRPWLFTAEPLGTHVLVHVRHGEPGARALLGSLTMHEREWRWLRAKVVGSAKIEELSK